MSKTLNTTSRIQNYATLGVKFFFTRLTLFLIGLWQIRIGLGGRGFLAKNRTLLQGGTSTGKGRGKEKSTEVTEQYGIFSSFLRIACCCHLQLLLEGVSHSLHHSASSWNPSSSLTVWMLSTLDSWSEPIIKQSWIVDKTY